jgi:hypothetical protein
MTTPLSIHLAAHLSRCCGVVVLGMLAGCGQQSKIAGMRKEAVLFAQPFFQGKLVACGGRTFLSTIKGEWRGIIEGREAGSLSIAELANPAWAHTAARLSAVELGYRLTDADLRNGIDYKGWVLFTATALREWTGENWSEWRGSHSSDTVFLRVQHRDGKWSGSYFGPYYYDDVEVVRAWKASTLTCASIAALEGTQGK